MAGISETGKRRRGKGKPFQPGQSGNPNGRPRGYAEFRALCRDKTDTALATLLAAMDGGGSEAVTAAKVVLEYGWGKSPAAEEDREAVKESGLVVRVVTLE